MRSTISPDRIQARLVRTERRGSVGIITLDRPQALNALTLETVERIGAALQQWSGLRAVVLTSASPKSFSAGGDLRVICEQVRAGNHDAAMRYFQSEYELDALIAESPVPVVSLIDGICMGGGMGLSMHGQFRVVSSNAILAMPEAAIGFFPDVGASYFLSRLPGALGLYLGLTGFRLGAADALYTGLATHFIDATRMGEVPEALVRDPQLPVDQILSSLSPNVLPSKSELAHHRSDIDRCFSAPTLEDIDYRLAATDGIWAATTRYDLHRMSPQSLAITHELISWGKQQSLRRCLATELRLTRQVISSPDFLEGVRAALLDKDHRPAWSSPPFTAKPGRTSVWRTEISRITSEHNRSKSPCQK